MLAEVFKLRVGLRSFLTQPEDIEEHFEDVKEKEEKEGNEGSDDDEEEKEGKKKAEKEKEEEEEEAEEMLIAGKPRSAGHHLKGTEILCFFPFL